MNSNGYSTFISNFLLVTILTIQGTPRPNGRVYQTTLGTSTHTCVRVHITEEKCYQSSSRCFQILTKTGLSVNHKVLNSDGREISYCP